MAHLGKIEVVVSDPATGLPVSGATVEIRKQGGTVQGTTGPTTINLHAQGALDVDDTLNVDADTLAVVTLLTQPTGTQITVSGVGFTPLVNDVSRITATLPLPSIFNAEDAGEVKANPLSTDANGLAFAFAPVGFYDVLVTRAGVKTLLTNVIAGAGADFVSNIWGTGSATAFNFDTHRALAADDILVRFRDNGVTKVLINKDGGLTAVTGLFSGAATVVGNLNLVARLVMSATASQLTPGATSFAIRDNANARDNLLILDAGDVTIFRDLDITRDANFRRIRLDKGTVLVSGDFADETNMGTGATYAPTGTDAAGRATVTLGTGLGAGNPEFRLTYTDGTYGDFANVMVTCHNTTTSDVVPIFASGGSTSVLFTIGDATPTDSHVYEIVWIGVGRT